MATEIVIRPFSERDAVQVRELFITINRLLAPPHLRDVFEAYIERSLVEEIDRIPAYYTEHVGSFWVAVKDDKVVGMFGLEGTSDGAKELRRMYVDPPARGYRSADAPVGGRRMPSSRRFAPCAQYIGNPGSRASALQRKPIPFAPRLDRRRGEQ